MDCGIYAPGAKIFCVIDACRGFNQEDSKDIFKKLEYEKVRSILSNGLELLQIYEREMTQSLSLKNSICDINCKGSAQYEINHEPIDIGEKPWADRKQKITMISDELKGSSYIKGHFIDRASTATDFMELNIKIRCKLYILWPVTNIESKWIKSNLFKKTSFAAYTDDSNICFNIYERSNIITPGEKVVLGGNEGSLSDLVTLSYIVCFKELRIY